MKVRWYNKKWIQIIFHLLFWVILFSLPYLLRQDYDNEKHHNEKHNETAFTYLYISHILVWMALFYLNAYVLVPQFIYRKKFMKYVIAQLVLLVLVFAIDRIVFDILVGDKEYRLRNALFNIFPYIFIIACSTAYQVIRDRMHADKLAHEKENENLKTELVFLRSQVSPHFMFNVLNNMVALSRKHSEQLEPSLIKLSSLMRYMLYETDEDKVAIDKEIDYLQSYIDLQQQRFGKKVTIQTNMTEVDKSYFIEPMLLIPFVENAFKHGTGLIEDAAIIIDLKAKDGKLNFFVKNKFNGQEDGPKDKTSGIGLVNVKRRLNLLYGNNHSIEIDKKNEWFTVSLHINLH